MQDHSKKYRNESDPNNEHNSKNIAFQKRLRQTVSKCLPVLRRFLDD